MRALLDGVDGDDHHRVRTGFGVALDPSRISAEQKDVDAFVAAPFGRFDNGDRRRAASVRRERRRWLVVFGRDINLVRERVERINIVSRIGRENKENAKDAIEEDSSPFAHFAFLRCGAGVAGMG